MNNQPNQTLKLPLWGTAQLEFENQAVPIRKKSLAILYYLALEGATSRDTLADLIWDRLDATSNLRVELHDLRLKLQPLGIQAFPRGQNPLKLPEGIILEPGKRNTELRSASLQPMEGLERGLDQISTAFEQWLAARRRSLIDPVQATWGREKLIATLAAQVQNAGVLVLSSLPGFDTTNVVRELARSLNLSFVEGLTGPAKSLKFLKQPFAQNALENIIEHTEGVVVVSLSTFGELPRLILELEERLSDSRLIYFDLKPLSWLMPEVDRWHKSVFRRRHNIISRLRAIQPICNTFWRARKTPDKGNSLTAKSPLKFNSKPVTLVTRRGWHSSDSVFNQVRFLTG